MKKLWNDLSLCLAFPLFFIITVPIVKLSFTMAKHRNLSLPCPQDRYRFIPWYSLHFDTLSFALDSHVPYYIILEIRK